MEYRRMSVGPRDVLRLKRPTNGFLCPLSAALGIEFLSFVITDDESKRVLVEIRNDVATAHTGHMEIDYEDFDEENCYRAIKYTFSEDVLRQPLIGTSLTFKVGPEPLSDFRMIERHYFRNQLIRCYDFTFGFCMPGSVNTWQSVYDVPSLKDNVIREMIENPYETKSDTFYFVRNELVMHNKARYRYVADDSVYNSASGAIVAGIRDFSMVEHGGDARSVEDSADVEIQKSRGDSLV